MESHFTQSTGSQPIKTLKDLAGHLQENIVSQREAIQKITETLPAYLLRLNQQKIIPLLLFYGPPSVGKKTVAIAVNKHLYGEQAGHMVLDLAGMTRTHLIACLSEVANNTYVHMIVFNRIECATADIISLIIDVVKQGKLITHTGHHDLSHILFILIKEISVKAQVEWHEPNKEEDHFEKTILQLVVNDMPKAMVMSRPLAGQATSEATEQLNDLPAVLLATAELIEFTGFDPEEFIELAKHYCGQLSEQVKKQHQVILQFAPGLIEALLASQTMEIISAKTLHKQFDALLIPKLTQALLQTEEDKKTIRFSLSGGNRIVARVI